MSSPPVHSCSSGGKDSHHRQGIILSHSPTQGTDSSLLPAVIPVYDSMKWLGVVICGVAILCVPFLHWPMWGGMIFPIKKGYTEEDYYFAEYNAEEREKGLHLANSAFVSPALCLLIHLGWASWAACLAGCSRGIRAWGRRVVLPVHHMCSVSWACSWLHNGPLRLWQPLASAARL